MCLKSQGKSLDAVIFILRDEELKARSIKKREPSQGWGFCKYSEAREVFHIHTPVFICSFPKNNFIKLPIAWYLSES